jgi:hypothetical protein
MNPNGEKLTHDASVNDSANCKPSQSTRNLLTGAFYSSILYTVQGKKEEKKNRGVYEVQVPINSSIHLLNVRLKIRILSCMSARVKIWCVFCRDIIILSEIFCQKNENF